MKQTLKNKKPRYAYFAVFIVLLLITACSGDTEGSSWLSEVFNRPVGEISVLEFMLIVYLLGLLT